MCHARSVKTVYGNGVIMGYVVVVQILGVYKGKKTQKSLYVCVV